MSTKQELQKTVDKLTSENETLNRTVDKLEDMLHAVAHQPAKQAHTVEIGTTINLGNYSNITMKVHLGLESSQGDLSDSLKSVISTARQVLGETLIEVLTSPPEQPVIGKINKIVNPNLEGIIKNNSAAVWLIGATVTTDTIEDELPF